LQSQCHIDFCASDDDGGGRMGHVMGIISHGPTIFSALAGPTTKLTNRKLIANALK